MGYALTDSLTTVAGIGPVLADRLAEVEITTVLDFLLCLPLRYEDRSNLVPIAEIPDGELVTIRARVDTYRSFYKNRRSIVTATVSDDSDSLKVTWFNNRYIASKLRNNQEYYFSGKLGKYGGMTQPTVEAIGGDTIHTNRLVPQYTTTIPLKVGTTRRLLKHICDDLVETTDTLTTTAEKLGIKLPSLAESLKTLHFPDESSHVVSARERLAVEELVLLIQTSQALKQQWHKKSTAPSCNLPKNTPEIPETIPFQLTEAQLRAQQEIRADLATTTAMNRLLVGDVGSGKTVVAGLALRASILSGQHGCVIAPTQILAEQHAATLADFFPKLPLVLVTGNTKPKAFDPTKPQLIVGTHAVLNLIKNEDLSPGLVVYDEQHRFGVKQRSHHKTHTLTMTATPIPRSLMLTIFSHLSLSILDELPSNRIPTKTWLLPKKKYSDLLGWVTEQTQADPGNFLTLIVCPFIAPSSHEPLKKVASVKEQFQHARESFPDDIRLAQLHSKLSQQEKERCFKQLYAGKIDVLVTTPMVEVGVDIPQASAVIIMSAERFGLASLHQLRGRVGRAGQQGYCALFRSSGTKPSERLRQFESILDGQELAQIDLENRGAGDLFGTEQHGFDQLRFASWTNTERIQQAQQIAQALPNDWQSQIAVDTAINQDIRAN